MPKTKTEQDLLEEAFDEITSETDPTHQDDPDAVGNDKLTEDGENGSSPQDDSETGGTGENENSPAPVQRADADDDNDSSSGDTNDEQSTGESDQDTDYKALYEKEVQRRKTCEGRLAAANQQVSKLKSDLEDAKSTPTSKDPVQSGIQEGTSQTPGDDDERAIAEFVEEFPALDQPLRALIRKEAAAIANERVAQIQPQVEKLSESSRQRAIEAHFAKIEAAHKGWQSYVKDGSLLRWVEAQPTFLKDRCREIYEKGTADELIAMLDSFTAGKKSKPRPSPKKVDDIIAVPARTSSQPKTDSPANDFEAAWEEAVAEE